MPDGPVPDRPAQVDDALRGVRERISRAARDAGRDPAGVTLVAVTKFFPATDVVVLTGLGVTDVGESRDQEARPKRAEVAAALAATGSPAPRWHFLGRLQRNKAVSVGRWADVVHSLDRVELVAPLARGAADRDDPARAGSRLEVFVQVSLDGAPGRGGAPVASVGDVAASVAAEPALLLRGVMAVAPQGVDPAAAFARLADVAASVRAAHPGADAVSAGMSGDLEAALAHGATHLRVGSALLGSRPPNLG